jgi:membrane fusion protein, multidrug efflux system
MATTTEQTTVVKTEKKKKSKGFLIVLILLLVFGGWFGLTKYNHSLHHAETDDAQLEANIAPIVPRVSGYVKAVRVKDNQLVKKGDTLVILDDRDLRMKVSSAEAALATAQSTLGVAEATTTAATTNIATTRASIGTIEAQIKTADVALWRANQDFQRYENLYKDHSITKQQYEQALAAKQTAERQLDVLREQRNQAAQQTKAVASQSAATGKQVNVANATIQQRKVEVEDAKLNLSYAVITAPEDGIISKVNVQEGQLVQTGQSLFNVVLSDELWVVANFKETQIGKMKPGQKVTVHVDAFSDHDFEATLSSFSPATGAKFALLPPDNASGNFVKVVQRVPVKIEFSKNDPMAKQLRAGMNVSVDVHLD